MGNVFIEFDQAFVTGSGGRQIKINMYLELCDSACTNSLGVSPAVGLIDSLLLDERITGGAAVQ